MLCVNTKSYPLIEFFKQLTTKELAEVLQNAGEDTELTDTIAETIELKDGPAIDCHWFASYEPGDCYGKMWVVVPVIGYGYTYEDVDDVYYHLSELWLTKNLATDEEKDVHTILTAESIIQGRR